jgi:hypothetical protein
LDVKAKLRTKRKLEKVTSFFKNDIPKYTPSLSDNPAYEWLEESRGEIVEITILLIISFSGVLPTDISIFSKQSLKSREPDNAKNHTPSFSSIINPQIDP